jgi:hypothetical protein
VPTPFTTAPTRRHKFLIGKFSPAMLFLFFETYLSLAGLVQ